MSPLASGAVYVTERYATRPGDPYVIKATNLTTAIALLELILIEVVYGMYLTYGTTISAASFALGGSENGSFRSWNYRAYLATEVYSYPAD